jgi:hypothetical protein
LSVNLEETMAFWLATDSATITLLFQMLLIFGAAKLFAEIAEAVGQPAVVGELIAGVVIGPSVLNWVCCFCCFRWGWS